MLVPRVIFVPQVDTRDGLAQRWVVSNDIVLTFQPLPDLIVPTQFRQRTNDAGPPFVVSRGARTTQVATAARGAREEVRWDEKTR